MNTSVDREYTEKDTDAIATAILDLVPQNRSRAVTIALSGDLGAGKTTLTKALAEALGVEETVVSPTFVIAKFYPLTHQKFTQMVHIDAYRIESLEELVPLRWIDVISNPDNVVVVEWPERIEGALPPDVIHFHISHRDEGRHITQL